MSKKILLGSIAAMLALAVTANAADDDEVRFEREIRSCIAEINDRADYDDATRVRHTVIEVKNTFSGYVLSISTGVFADAGDTAIREYESYCVAKGDARPKKFSIDKVSG